MASGDSVKVLDLDELLLEYAKDLYELKRKELEKKWGAKDKEFEWERVPKALRKERLAVETVSTSYRSHFAPGGLALPASPTAGSKVGSTTAADSPSKGGDAEEGAAPKHRSLFRTEYRNTTDIEQKYTLATERTTSQSVHMAFSRSITNTKECGIGIKLPEEILSVAAGLRRELNVTRATEESQESTVSWSLQSEVTVPPKCVTCAELVLLEYEFGTRFEAIVRLSGRVGVVVYAPSAVDRRLNELSGAASGTANELLLLNFDVVNVLRNPESSGFMSNREAQELGKGPGLYYRLEGRCNFRFGTEQKVLLTQKPL